jgi:hypothetical protein
VPRSAAYPTLVVSLANQSDDASVASHSDDASVVAHAFALEVWRDEIADVAFHIEGRGEQATSGEGARLLGEERASAFLSEHPLDEKRRVVEVVRRFERLLRERRSQMTGVRVVGIFDGTLPGYRQDWTGPIRALQTIRDGLLQSSELKDLVKPVSSSVNPVVCTVVMLTQSDEGAERAWAQTLESKVHREDNPVGCIYLSLIRDTHNLKPHEKLEQAQQALRLVAMEDFGSGTDQRAVLPPPNGAVRWRLWTMSDGEQDLREAQARQAGEQHVKYLLDEVLTAPQDVDALQRDEACEHATLWAGRFDHPDRIPVYGRALDQLGALLEAVGHEVADRAIEQLRNAPLDSHPNWARVTCAELEHRLDPVLGSWADRVGDEVKCHGRPEEWEAQVYKLHAIGPGIGASALREALEGPDGRSGRLGRLLGARGALSNAWQRAQAALTPRTEPKTVRRETEARLDAAKLDALRVLHESPTADSFRKAILPFAVLVGWLVAPWVAAAAIAVSVGPMPPNSGSVPGWLLDVLVWSIPEGLGLLFGPVMAPITIPLLLVYGTWRLLRYHRDAAGSQQERSLGPQGRLRAEILSAAHQSPSVLKVRAGVEERINRTVTQAVDRSKRSLERYTKQLRATERQLKWLSTRGFASLWTLREHGVPLPTDDLWAVVRLSNVTCVLMPPAKYSQERSRTSVHRPTPLWTDDVSPGATDARADTLLWPRRFLKQRGLREEWTPGMAVGKLVGAGAFGPLQQNFDTSGVHFVLRNDDSAIWKRIDGLEGVGDEERRWRRDGVCSLPIRDELRVVWLHRKESRESGQ